MNTIESTVKYIRSKNAGPFWLTIDAFCNNVEDTERVAAAFENNRAKIAADFQVKSEDLQIYCLKNIFVARSACLAFPLRAVATSGICTVVSSTSLCWTFPAERPRKYNRRKIRCFRPSLVL